MYLRCSGSFSIGGVLFGPLNRVGVLSRSCGGGQIILRPPQRLDHLGALLRAAPDADADRAVLQRAITQAPAVMAGIDLLQVPGGGPYTRAEAVHLIGGPRAGDLDQLRLGIC